MNEKGQLGIIYLVFIASIIAASFLIASLTQVVLPVFVISLFLGIVIFIISFLNTEAALYIFIFSMLLGPEFIASDIAGGGAGLGRGVTLRLDDFLLAIIGFSWFARTAIHKELGLFLKTPLNLPILFYTLSYVFATGFGMITGRVSPLTGFFFVLKYIEYFIVYFMVVNYLHSEKQAKRFVFCSLLTCFLVSLYGLFQIPLGERISAPFEGEVGEPNTFGGYLVFMIAIASGILLNWKTENGMYKIMLRVLIIFSFIALLFTLSRSSYLAFTAMFFALIIFSEKKWPMLAILAFALVLSPYALPKSVKERVFFTFMQPKERGQIEVGGLRIDTSTSDRIRSWRNAMSDFIKKPVFGYGVTGYGFMDAQLPRILMETGIIGLLAFIYLLYSIFTMAYERLKTLSDTFNRGLVIGFLTGFVALFFHAIGTNTFIIVRIMEPFWLFTGIVIMLPVLEKEKELIPQSNATPIHNR